MGLNLSFIPFFDACYKQNIFTAGSILVLGSQVIHDEKAAIMKFADAAGHHSLLKTASIRDLFKDRFNITEYRDCDINDSADMKIDLSKDLPADMKNRFPCILEAGTFEHIFDIAAAFKNLHEMTAPGGYMLHIAPVSWLNHAFYNLNPSLFEAVSKVNKYKKIVDAYHFPAARSFLKTASAPDIFITFNGEADAAEQERAKKRLTANGIAAHCLYMCAYLKTEDTAFKIPYDITD